MSTLKAGTKVVVTFIRPEGNVSECATVRRVSPSMLPLPPGYVPVRFALDSATLLVHSTYITEAA